MCSVRSEKLHESSQAVKPAVSKEEVEVVGGGVAGAAEKSAQSDRLRCALMRRGVQFKWRSGRANAEMPQC